MQIDSKRLDIDRLCRMPSTKEMALRLWDSTGNLLTWFFRQFEAAIPVFIGTTTMDEERNLFVLFRV